MLHFLKEFDQQFSDRRARMRRRETAQSISRTSAWQNKLPRWRGFNLLEKFSTEEGIKPFRESDFELVSSLGFNFVRLPMTYMAWTDDDDLFKIKECGLTDIDDAIEWGKQYGIHVNLSFHRAPGYSVKAERKEPFSLWRDAEALRCCATHWQHFTQRYQGISSDRLSFNLWNEPGDPDPATMTAEEHDRAAVTVIAAIRQIDPKRLIIVDGLNWGTVPSPTLAELDVAQSCRGYRPLELTHYQARWVEGQCFPQPTWPLIPQRSPEMSDWYATHSTTNTAASGFDRDLLEEWYEPWVRMRKSGIGIHCGEFGVFNKTPHRIALKWMEDLLQIFAMQDIGWALWNLRGPFGVLDSGRKDVRYEKIRGAFLDRRMLELLRRY